jgi:hypothetical protein
MAWPLHGVPSDSPSFDALLLVYLYVALYCAICRHSLLTSHHTTGLSRLMLCCGELRHTFVNHRVGSTHVLEALGSAQFIHPPLAQRWMHI